MRIPFSFIFKTQHVSDEGKLRSGFVAANRSGDSKTYHTSDKSRTGHGNINEAILASLLQEEFIMVSDVRSPMTATPLLTEGNEEFMNDLDASFCNRNKKQSRYPKPTALLAHCQYVEQVFGITRQEYSPLVLSDAWCDLLVGNPIQNASMITMDADGRELNVQVGRGTQFFDLEITSGHTTKCVSVKTSQSLKDKMRVTTISQEAAALWAARIDHSERMPAVPIIMIYPSKATLNKEEIDGNIFHTSQNVRVAVGYVNWNSVEFVEKGGTVDVMCNIARSHKSTINWDTSKEIPSQLLKWLREPLTDLGQPK